jgi:hypothetical protein
VLRFHPSISRRVAASVWRAAHGGDHRHASAPADMTSAALSAVMPPIATKNRDLGSKRPHEVRTDELEPRLGPVGRCCQRRT